MATIHVRHFLEPNRNLYLTMRVLLDILMAQTRSHAGAAGVDDCQIRYDPKGGRFSSDPLAVGERSLSDHTMLVDQPLSRSISIASQFIWDRLVGTILLLRLRLRLHARMQMVCKAGESRNDTKRAGR